jgi:anti-sigma factor RsiW
MNHEVAANSHAVERYLLGEMPVPERDAFEEHYFTCAECAGEIRSASELMRDMKAALRDFRSQPEASSTAGWLSWLRRPMLVPTFAAVTLAFVVGYQNVAVLPDLAAPRSMNSPLILDGRTRGDAPALKAGDPVRLMTALDGATAATKVFVEIVGAAGSAVRSGDIAAPSAGRPLDVYFPGSLAAGRYQLVVREGKEGKELARSVFEVVN